MTARAPDVFDPSAYPRTYKLSLAGKCLLSVLGLVLIFSSLTGLLLFSPAGQAGFYAVCGALALLGICLLATAVFYRVIMEADSIQAFEIYRRRNLARRDIEGRSHFSNGQGASGWVLVPKAGFGRKMQLSRLLKTDKAFLSWIRSLPDLDQGKKYAAAQEKTAAIAALKQRGFSQSAIERLRRFAVGLTFANYGLGLASLFVRDASHLLIWALIALPWVGILLVFMFAPYYRFGGPRNSPIPDLTLTLVLPGFFLAISVLQRIAPVGWEGPLMVAMLTSVVLVGVALWCDPWLKQHRGVVVLLLVLCCGYGYGAGMQVNALLDRSTPQLYRVIVTAKHVSQGRSTSYHLTLAPWGPNLNGQNLSVARSLYSEIKPGDTVCMLLRSGGLGAAWSELGSCEKRN
jgi:hypothetical protein